MLKLLLKICILTAGCALALYLCSLYLKGFELKGGFIPLLELSFVLALISATIKPVIQFFLKPLIWLTLGLLSLVINVLILKASMAAFPGIINISQTSSLIIATFVISIISSIIHTFFKINKHD